MTRFHGIDRRTHFLRKHLFWGGALISSGIALLLAEQGVIPNMSAWLLLPVLIGISALVKLVFAERTSQRLRAALGLALAAWLYACIEQLWGCSFSTTWPLALIYMGLCALTRSHSRGHAPQAEVIG